MLLPFLNQSFIEAGVDEAGRGCLAGPVFAAAVILPQSFEDPGLDDSKKMSHEKRLFFRSYILKHAAAYAIAAATAEEIDKINILNASILAMHRAIEALSMQPGFLIIDGNRFKQVKNIPYQTIIKGDGKYASIAAASILAKTERDFYMEKLADEFPIYNWQKNKGYPTLFHREQIIKHGISPHHRKSFCKNNLQLHLNF